MQLKKQKTWWIISWVDRCFSKQLDGDIESVELHHFSDASLTGYGQCTYLHLINQDNKIQCSLVYGKAGVAPLKPITIPRLELIAATLSVSASHLLKQELGYFFDFFECFTTTFLRAHSWLNWVVGVGLQWNLWIFMDRKKWLCFRPLLCTLFRLNWAKQTPGIMRRNKWRNLPPSGFEPTTQWSEAQHATAGLRRPPWKWTNPHGQDSQACKELPPPPRLTHKQQPLSYMTIYNVHKILFCIETINKWINGKIMPPRRYQSRLIRSDISDHPSQTEFRAKEMCCSTPPQWSTTQIPGSHPPYRMRPTANRTAWISGVKRWELLAIMTTEMKWWCFRPLLCTLFRLNWTTLWLRPDNIMTLRDVDPALGAPLPKWVFRNEWAFPAHMWHQSRFTQNNIIKYCRDKNFLWRISMTVWFTGISSFHSSGATDAPISLSSEAVWATKSIIL